MMMACDRRNNGPRLLLLENSCIRTFIHSFSQSFYKEAVVKLPVETTGGRRR